MEDGREGTASTAPLLSALVHALPWWPQDAAELGIAFEDSYLTMRALQGRLVVRTKFPAVRTSRAAEPLDPLQLGWRWSGRTHIQLLGSTRTEAELSHFSDVLDVTVRRSLGEDRLTGFMYGAPEAA
ncbi:hypothetical protein [Antribacter gilvus]|uniref:hypothetical protein n=1 Tax=Antribacter gilvus TaxID=2304675 RepID=UPI000F7B3F8A|nr:hypothetical protein [Antribacter gilvus]